MVTVITKMEHPDQKWALQGGRRRSEFGGISGDKKNRQMMGIWKEGLDRSHIFPAKEIILCHMYKYLLLSRIPINEIR